MATLDADARATIRAAGTTPAVYIRATMGEATWHGDTCGCTDDRCRGHHHADADPCGCLPVLLEDVAATGS